MSQIVFDLVYREKGEKKSRQIKIDFVSNYMRREITEYFQAAFEVKSNWNKLNDTASDIAALRIEKKDGYKIEVAALEAEQERITEDILKHNNSGLVDKNVNLLIELLQDNGIKDEKMVDPKFWDKCVEPSQIIEILARALNKDTDKKKVNI
mgnify:CR=1 FL=1